MGEERSGCFGKSLACGCGGCLLVLLALVGLAALGGGAAMLGMSKSEPYAEVLARARSNPRVVEALGEPLEPGLLITGSINLDGASGAADLAIPVSGPRGKGRLYVVATKSAGEWRYASLVAEIEATGERIDLAAGAGTEAETEAGTEAETEAETEADGESGPVEAMPGGDEEV